MKKFFLWLMVCILVWLMTSNVYAFVRNPSDCSLFDVGCVRDQFSVTNYGVWSPSKGAILYYGGNGMFQAWLYFDKNAKTFYQNNLWAGFEIDVHIHSNNTVFRINPDLVKGPSSTDPLRDTIIGDWGDSTRGITVIHPSKIREGWNVFSFRLRKPLSSGSNFTVNIQLVANVAHSQFADILFANNDNEWAYNQLYQWLVVAELGYNFSLGGEVFKYFVMANSGQSLSKEDGTCVELQDVPYGQGLCWFSRDEHEYAKNCNSSNFLDVIKTSQEPSDNSVLDKAEEKVSEISQEELVETVNAQSGTDFSVQSSNHSEPSPSHSHPTILSCQVRINGITDFQHKVIQALRPGQSFQIDIKAKIKNQGEEKSNNADLDYRIDKEKNKFDTNDTNLGDDEIDINPGETITEYKRNIKVKLSDDGTKITISKNNHKESFPVKDQEAHFYIFLDVEDNNHQDISSENDKDEYAKVTIQALSPPENSQNTISQEKLLQEILPLINTLLLK